MKQIDLVEYTQKQVARLKKEGLITYHGLAKLIGVSPSSFSRWMRGFQEFPADRVEELAQILLSYEFLYKQRKEIESKIENARRGK